MALTPFQLRAEWARSPVVRTSTRMRALAARLDGGVRRLHQDREVGDHQLGVGLAEQAEAVELVLDLLGVVEDEGHVAVGRGDGGRQPQDDRVATLHVAGAEAVQQVALATGRQVVVERHRVEVARDHDPLAAAEVGARDDGVAVAGDGQVVERAQRAFDGVGDRLLVAAHRLDVDQLLGQGDGVGREVEVGHDPIQPSTSLPAAGDAVLAHRQRDEHDQDDDDPDQRVDHRVLQRPHVGHRGARIDVAEQLA